MTKATAIYCEDLAILKRRTEHLWQVVNECDGKTNLYKLVEALDDEKTIMDIVRMRIDIIQKSKA